LASSGSSIGSITTDLARDRREIGLARRGRRTQDPDARALVVVLVVIVVIVVIVGVTEDRQARAGLEEPRGFDPDAIGAVDQPALNIDSHARLGGCPRHTDHPQRAIELVGEFFDERLGIGNQRRDVPQHLEQALPLDRRVHAQHHERERGVAFERFEPVDHDRH